MNSAVMDDSASSQDRRSFWQNIKEGYEALVLTVIRPMRALYHTENLGPTPCMLGSDAFERNDIQLKNEAGYTLECSWWKPYSPSKQDVKPMPCIISLHGNSSCRLGCMDLMYHALTSGFSLFAFDFCGSGLSEGKYVSLGYHESRDIAAVVEYLRASDETSEIILWGRSMGSVAAMIYAERDLSISAMVLDCPFAKLSQLAIELVDDGKLNVPKIAVRIVMRMVRRSIKKRAKFDMYKLKPIAKIHKSTIPTFFAVALEDEVIAPRHCEQLHAKHTGQKELFKFPGGHNSTRPLRFYQSAIKFIQKAIGVDDEIRAPSCRNPLPEGIKAEKIDQMSVHELKQAVERTGFSHSRCVEKKDLIELVKKIYNRYEQSSRKNDKLLSDDGYDSPNAFADQCAGTVDLDDARLSNVHLEEKEDDFRPHSRSM